MSSDLDGMLNGMKNDVKAIDFNENYRNFKHSDKRSMHLREGQNVWAV